MVAYFNLTVIAEWITMLAALFILDKKTKQWRLFIPLFILILCVETTGWLMLTKFKNNKNALPFNLLMLTSISFFIWFIGKEIKTIKIKSWLTITLILFLVLGAVNLFFFQGFSIYNSVTEAVGDILLSILCCYFLFMLVKNPPEINLIKHGYFWLVTGVLFYSLGSAMLYQFSYLLAAYHKKAGLNLGNYINYALNIVLYTSMIIAFICRRKATR